VRRHRMLRVGEKERAAISIREECERILGQGEEKRMDKVVTNEHGQKRDSNMINGEIRWGLDERAAKV